jgi:hypothetical protein
LIETAAMLSIAATLVLAFLGGRPEATGVKAEANRQCEEIP